MLVGTAVVTRTLPAIWALILINPLLTWVWLRLDHEAGRGWSHLLVLMQTLLLFGLGRFCEALAGELSPPALRAALL